MLKFRSSLLLATVIIALFTFNSCKKDENTEEVTNEPQLIFKFTFDSTQVRLNNFGQNQSIPAGHGAQCPVFSKMSAHYLELAPDSLTLLGFGKVLYRADETTAGGTNAIDFSKCTQAGNGEVFLKVPLSQVSAGTYKWLRVSLAYQKFDIKMLVSGFNLTGTLCSFIGYNTYITSYTPQTTAIAVNGNRLQGYWGFETSVLGSSYSTSGQAPPGATTVVNPIAASSPVPAGSCVVTGRFPSSLVITGNETADVVVNVSVSTNNSFEWTDAAGNNIYEPADGDTVVDMGVRGIIPSVE